MESPQSVVSPLELFPNGAVVNPRNLDSENSDSNSPFIGEMDVHVHQARDIHNICIYHKQDVYAKLSLSTDPDCAVSTKTVNGGGRNPVFDEILRLHIRAADSSLRCEVWMMSRARNYLEDQLLGIASIPLSKILHEKTPKDFSLSSSDIIHCPSGFLLLSFSYNGSSIVEEGINPQAAEKTSESISNPCDYDMIQFPDLKTLKENQIMVEEYTGVDCSESLASSDMDEVNSEIGVHLVKSFASVDIKKDESSSSPSSSPSEKSSPVFSTTESSMSSRWEECDGSVVEDEKSKPLPISEVDVNVQRNIVDLYMKSMQQFTDSLANMKLPMDVQSCRSPSEDSTNNSSNVKKVNTPTTTTTHNSSGNGRVFYGSRAFF